MRDGRCDFLQCLQVAASRDISSTQWRQFTEKNWWAISFTSPVVSEKKLVSRCMRPDLGLIITISKLLI